MNQRITPPGPGDYITSEFLSSLAGAAPVPIPAEVDEVVQQKPRGGTLRSHGPVPTVMLGRVSQAFARPGGGWNWTYGFVMPYGLEKQERSLGVKVLNSDITFYDNYLFPDSNYEELNKSEDPRLVIDPMGRLLPGGTIVHIIANKQTGFLEILSAPAVFQEDTHLLEAWGGVLGGSAELTYSIQDPGDNYTIKSKAIEIPWNCTSAQLAELLNEHPSLEGHVFDAATLPTDDEDFDKSSVWALTNDGPWPMTGLSIRFLNALGQRSVRLPGVTAVFNGGLHQFVQVSRRYMEMAP